MSVTLFYSDVTGFSAMTERLGDALAFAVMSDFLRVLRDAAARYGGREVEIRGDACLLTFASADAGLDCAMAVQRALAERRRADPEHSVELRIGLHAGEPIAHEAGVFGRDVIVAARLADACRTNAILVSRSFQRLLRDPSRIGRERALRLKGLRAPEPASRVYWGARYGRAGGARSRRRGASQGPFARLGSWCGSVCAAVFD
jgi:class 3 adenylate cyclase